VCTRRKSIVQKYRPLLWILTKRYFQIKSRAQGLSSLRRVAVSIVSPAAIISTGAPYLALAEELNSS